MKNNRGPWLYLHAEDDGLTQWIIIHGGRKIATGFSAPEKDEATAELVDYAKNFKRLPKDWKPRVVVPRSATTLFVYFISTDDVPRFPIKIGITDNLAARMAGLQTGCPYNLKLLAAMQGLPSLEKQLHTGFLKQRLSGEWFKRSRALMDYIATIPNPESDVPPLFERE